MLMLYFPLYISIGRYLHVNIFILNLILKSIFLPYFVCIFFFFWWMRRAFKRTYGDVFKNKTNVNVKVASSWHVIIYLTKHLKGKLYK